MKNKQHPNAYTPSTGGGAPQGKHPTSPSTGHNPFTGGYQPHGAPTNAPTANKNPQKPGKKSA
jgi:hypothetical protein